VTFAKSGNVGIAATSGIPQLLRWQFAPRRAQENEKDIRDDDDDEDEGREGGRGRGEE